MQIPETPHRVEELDLMRRLNAYANGTANWHTDRQVGAESKSACAQLHAHITGLVSKTLSWILDRVGAREMDSFTMHDRSHSIKVAHLMWHILEPSRRDRLTPPEIGMLVLSAYVHDLGMALDKDERDERLAAGSDLWTKLEVQESVKSRTQLLRNQIASTDDYVARRAKSELDQMEEALLCQDTRERHAQRSRYEQIIEMLRAFHSRNPENIPSVDECLSFSGDSFRDKLIDVCVSHNEDAEALSRRSHENLARLRFSSDFPVGAEVVDLHMVAAALRLADILDFDRERTPAALFYYLIPSTLSPIENRTVLEWGKHMAISGWQLEKDAIVFRGRCRDHIIHHAIFQFCAAIQNEIAATRSTYGALQDEVLWPFQLPNTVKAEIHEEGYRYVPYRFELDDQRIYELLMGGAIYGDSRVAVRELIQNAVDACKLRDALTQLHDPYMPTTSNRVFVQYEEPNEKHAQPTVTVLDTGIGMDAFIIERYFLKVGQSYYRSVDFSRQRIELQKKSLDFAPVSEFGIGFLSCFLLSDRVEVQTAMSEPIRGDTRKRTLVIDGPTRLIRLNEDSNEGAGRFRGTSVKLYISRGSKQSKSSAPSWTELREYLEDVCQDLPYRLHLQHIGPNGVVESWIDPKPLSVEVPPYLERAMLRIRVNDLQFGLEGEIALTNVPSAVQAERELSTTRPSPVVGRDSDVDAERMYHFGFNNPYAEVFRGGFKIGEAKGLPERYLNHTLARARLRLTWQSTNTRRFFTPNLSRNSTSDDRVLADNIARVWITYLLEHVDELPEGQLHQVDIYWPRIASCSWLEKFDALQLYRLGVKGWQFELKRLGRDNDLRLWEQGDLELISLGEGRHELFGSLLEIVLPKISSLVVGSMGHRYFGRPAADWKDTLRGWRTQISNPAGWGLFVSYIEPIQDLLWYDYPGYDFFNLRYRERIEFLGEERLKLLLSGLNEFADSHERGRLPVLKHAEAEVLRLVIEKIGDLAIGSMYGTWRLNTFTIAEGG